MFNDARKRHVRGLLKFCSHHNIVHQTTCPHTYPYYGVGGQKLASCLKSLKNSFIRCMFLIACGLTSVSKPQTYIITCLLLLSLAQFLLVVFSLRLIMSFFVPHFFKTTNPLSLSLSLILLFGHSKESLLVMHAYKRLSCLFP